MRKFFHQFERITTFRDGKYISVWNKYSSALVKTSKDPNLWCQRALVCLKEDNIELQQLSYKGRYYYAEALRALGLLGMSASEYEKLKDLS
ncbi:mynd domain protein [Gigaspora margarita]|uniref:Mynd domain protein n=1 Tax=Gigaspora margarita TaxID=4874 RepID=A0A8H3X934_GIGMA|nr:mynd domain protein [Gigaspora margarita]